MYILHNVKFLFLFQIFFILFSFDDIYSREYTSEIKEVKIGTLQFGMNDGIKNTEIFPYASRAQQGMAIIRHKGVESLFVTVRASKNSGSDKGQSCRITQFNFRSDGSLDPRPICFSKILPIGHGQGFGVIKEKGELYFFCQTHYTDDQKTCYKGVSRIHWRGAETGPEDITEIPLIPSSGNLSQYGFLTPNISTDGKYLVTLCKTKNGHSCLVWKMDKLEPYAKPISIFPIHKGIAKGNSWQGLCADSRYIYFIHGGVKALKRHAIAIYDYKGKMIKEFLIQDEKAVYGGDKGIMSWKHGVPWQIELEGIVIQGKDLLITGPCTIIPDGDIVEWKGENFVCIKTTNGNIQPNDTNYWMKTLKKTTAGSFIINKIYKSGIDIENKGRRFIKKYKFVYRLVNAVL